MNGPLDFHERDKLHQALAEGVDLYNGGSFFECHEVLEEVWLSTDGKDKAFLQGLIKIAAAFHHYGKGTYRGMLDLLKAGHSALEDLRPSYQGVELERFLRAVLEWIPRAEHLLRGGRRQRHWHIPPIEYEAPD